MAPKISSLIDYHKIEDGKLKQYINCAGYGKEKWVTLERLFNKKEFDFIDLLFLKLTGVEPSKEERRLFLKTLMILSLGTGCHPPSVMVPKLVSSTTKNREFAIINGLIGGLATIGTDHLGAVTESMKTMVKLKKECAGQDTTKAVADYVSKKIKNKEKIRGFGHPVYEQDPRPKLLLKEIKKAYKKNQYIDIYSCLEKKLFEQKKIYPNIDAILALSYTCMGFEPEQGVYLSFLSRSLSMVSHITEELPKKPFSFLNEMVNIEDFY